MKNLQFIPYHLINCKQLSSTLHEERMSAPLRMRIRGMNVMIVDNFVYNFSCLFLRGTLFFCFFAHNINYRTMKKEKEKMASDPLHYRNLSDVSLNDVCMLQSEFFAHHNIINVRISYTLDLPDISIFTHQLVVNTQNFQSLSIIQRCDDYSCQFTFVTSLPIDTFSKLFSRAFKLTIDYMHTIDTTYSFMYYFI